MNYEMLFSQLRDRNIRMALTGAKGGFGRSLLVQCRAIPQIVIAALCDLDVEGTLNLLASLGFATDAAARCDTREQAQQASEAGKIAVVADAALLDALPLDIVVEATGQPESSVEIALAAIRRKVHGKRNFHTASAGNRRFRFRKGRWRQSAFPPRDASVPSHPPD